MTGKTIKVSNVDENKPPITVIANPPEIKLVDESDHGAHRQGLSGNQKRTEGLISVIIIGATVYIVARLLLMKSRVVDRPLMMLKERYVKSEISDEEYTRIRKTVNELK